MRLTRSGPLARSSVMDEPAGMTSPRSSDDVVMCMTRCRCAAFSAVLAAARSGATADSIALPDGPGGMRLPRSVTIADRTIAGPKPLLRTENSIKALERSYEAEKFRYGQTVALNCWLMMYL